MSEFMQWLIVGACVVGAGVFLAIRFRKSGRGECDKSCCGNCTKHNRK
jgi:hypothetical protein